VVGDRATVKHDAMSDRNAVAEDRRPALATDVDRRVVLDVGGAPDAHPFHVRTDDDLKPHTRSRADLDVADHVRRIVHVDVGREERRHAVVGDDHATTFTGLCRDDNPNILGSTDRPCLIRSRLLREAMVAPDFEIRDRKCEPGDLSGLFFHQHAWRLPR
jgi:hypothetical protein